MNANCCCAKGLGDKCTGHASAKTKPIFLPGGWLGRLWEVSRFLLALFRRGGIMTEAIVSEILQIRCWGGISILSARECLAHS